MSYRTPATTEACVACHGASGAHLRVFRSYADGQAAWLCTQCAGVDDRADEIAALQNKIRNLRELSWLIGFALAVVMLLLGLNMGAAIYENHRCDGTEQRSDLRGVDVLAPRAHRRDSYTLVRRRGSLQAKGKPIRLGHVVEC